MSEPLKKLKYLLVIAAIFLCVAALNMILNLAEGSLSLWERVQTAPLWLTAPFVIVSLLLLGFTLWLIWQLLRPKRSGLENQTAAPITAESVAQKYREVEAKGIAVDDAYQELQRWRTDKHRGEIIISFLGTISVGKSSLIKALLSDLEAVNDSRTVNDSGAVNDRGDNIQVDVVGGSTRESRRFVWKSSAGDQLILEDVPGLQEVKQGETQTLDELALETVQRSHVCVFVTEGDITKSEHSALKAMLALNKPTVLVLNKADRFTQTEITQLKTRLSNYISEIVAELTLGLKVPVVTAVSGGEENVEVHQQDGSVLMQSRPRNTQTAELAHALQSLIDANVTWLDSLRDSAVFILVDQKLEKAEKAYKKQQADKMVKTYTKRAIFGAMAAVAPGSDLIIQGYLGKQMVNEISAVYDIKARKVDIQTFLELVEQHLRKALPVVLAIAGNGLKAFPGIGTITGGLAHAGAYGLIFDAMGRSLSESMAVRGSLSPAPAATQFKDYLNENLALGTRRFAQLVLDARKDADKQ